MGMFNRKAKQEQYGVPQMPDWFQRDLENAFYAGDVHTLRALNQVWREYLEAEHNFILKG